jgi:uncharacterized protein YjaZ
MISKRRATANWATWTSTRRLKTLIKNKKMDKMSKSIMKTELKRRKL